MTTLAYSHTLVAGAPENINDVQDMFNDARTVINGNLDATNLAATAKPATLMGAYRTVSEAAVIFGSTSAAATYIPSVVGGPVAVGASTGSALQVIPITTADYAVSGLTTQFRIQAGTIVNTVAPGVNFTFALAPVSSSGGSGGNISIATIGALLGSVTRAAPTTGGFADSGADFTISANQLYVLCVTLSGTPAANSGTACQVRLQVHNI